MTNAGLFLIASDLSTGDRRPENGVIKMCEWTTSEMLDVVMHFISAFAQSVTLSIISDRFCTAALLS